jgi:hypothetical protein
MKKLPTINSSDVNCLRPPPRVKLVIVESETTPGLMSLRLPDTRRKGTAIKEAIVNAGFVVGEACVLVTSAELADLEADSISRLPRLGLMPMKPKRRRKP